MSMIQVENISKTYGKHTALENISLNIEKGQCFALLGRNGAGKTTLVKSLLGLLPMQKGKAYLQGLPVSHFKARENVSYMPEKFSFYPYYTLKGVCLFYGKMKGVPKSMIDEQAETALKKVNLLDVADKKVKTCSKGQLQRAGLAAMLMGESELYILDEPFSGLDPIAVKELQNLLSELKAKGKTLVINSHDLDHVKRICDHMAILDHGKCIKQGNIKDLIGDQDLLDYFYDQVGSHHES